MIKGPQTSPWPENGAWGSAFGTHPSGHSSKEAQRLKVKKKYVYVVKNCFKILAEGLRKEQLPNKPNLESLPEAATLHPSLNSRCNLSQMSPIIALNEHLFLRIVAQAPSSLLFDYILGFKFYLSSDYNKTVCLLSRVL